LTENAYWAVLITRDLGNIHRGFRTKGKFRLNRPGDHAMSRGKMNVLTCSFDKRGIGRIKAKGIYEDIPL